MRERGPDGVIQDVRRFARRRPGMFLLAAGVTGFAIGRIVKAGGMSGSQQDELERRMPTVPTRCSPTGQGGRRHDGSQHDRPRSRHQPLQADKSLGELFSELTSDLGHLFRQEVQLAKTEAREEVKQVGKGAGMLAGGRLERLAGARDAVADSGVVPRQDARQGGVVPARRPRRGPVIGTILAIVGKKQVARVRPLPETVQTLKEDAQWVKAQKN